MVRLTSAQTTSHSLTVGNQVSRTLQSTGLTNLAVIPFTFFDSLRWLIDSSMFCEGFDCPKKSTTPTHVIRNIFLHHSRKQHSNSSHIFTGGSKDGLLVGCSAGFADTTRSSKLSPSASNFFAGLYGILAGLQTVLTLNAVSFSIFTDSKSLILALHHLDSTNPLILQIHSAIQCVQSSNKTLSICWCPAHVGVPLNEAADDAARQAAQSNAEPVQLSVPYKDLYSAIKSSVKNSWQEVWSNTHGNELRSIKDSIVASPQSADHNRKSSIIITRLRIGHTRLTHQHLMERRLAPHCPFCANDTFTVKYLLAVYPQLTVSRQRWFPYCSPLLQWRLL